MPYRKRAKVIDAVTLVCVLVRQRHRVKTLAAGCEKLLTQVRRGVDQHGRRLPARRLSTAEEDRASRPAVTRLGRIARSPVIPDARHAAR